MYKYKFMAPLLNFDSDLSEVVLSENCIISKLNELDFEILEYAKKDFPTAKYQKWKIEVKIQKTKPEAVPDEYFPDGRKMIEQCVTALRLFQEGLVGFNTIIQRYNENSFGHAGTIIKHYELWIGEGSPYSGKPFIVNKEDIPQCYELFNYCQKSYDDNIIAINYFNKSYIEPYTPRDSFLDLIITFENLYLSGDTMELGYKLRVRMAFVLGTNDEDRQNIFDAIKKAYTMRSKIVHGEKIKGLDYKFLYLIRNYARASIIIFLKYVELNKKLDQLILSKKELENFVLEC